MENSFEKNITRLNEISSLLEKGDCGLDESLKLFSEGINLCNACQKELDEAKQKVKIIESSDNNEN